MTCSIIDTTIKYRSYTHFDQDAFLSDLGSVPWSIIELFDDVDDALHACEVLFMDVVNVHVPLRERRVKRPRQPGWLTDDITAAMATRDSYKQREDYINYKLCRSKVVQMIQEAKTVYYRKLARNTKFVIPDVTHEYVMHKLSTQANRATGADGISAKFIKISASHIAAQLRWIINLRLRTGVMPATWKHARVSPIYKTGDKAECGNYLHISVLCGISKVVERHVHDSLYTFFI